ncbi:MAG: recombinase family protein [Sphingobium sp.]
MARPKSEGARLRCAIYTRKSTEEGLDQSFNSLDAQREACAAYIMSQTHEGWEPLSELYDDGGYSGGSMDRPGLAALLQDVEAGKVDVIVVYKVDRLTRSLADFAKIVEILDKQNACFVSVTQAFNTTTSMGRLTLNVLLSFAQFEREVTGERIRDKIAASKARGMWMGGVVPLGYCVDSRKLVVVPDEAERVRHIFRRYLALGSVYALQAELARKGINTKSRIDAGGVERGNANFSRGALYQILRNRIYLGEICHKGTAFPGEHDAIIDEALFEKVNSLLDSRRDACADGSHVEERSLLVGLVWDGEGRRMTSDHATKRGGIRYRYYVSCHDKERPRLRRWRVPAGELERLVTAQIHCRQNTMPGAPLTRDDVRSIIQRITIEADHVRINFVGDEDSSAMVSARFVKRGNERRIDTPNDSGSRQPDPALVKLIVRAHQARQALNAAPSIPVAAAQLGLTQRYFAVLLRLSFLAPDITGAILDGKQPVALTRQRLARIGNLPLDWGKQRALLGFAPS